MELREEKFHVGHVGGVWAKPSPSNGRHVVTLTTSTRWSCGGAVYVVVQGLTLEVTEAPRIQWVKASTRCPARLLDDRIDGHLEVGCALIFGDVQEVEVSKKRAIMDATGERPVDDGLLPVYGLEQELDFCASCARASDRPYKGKYHSRRGKDEVDDLSGKLLRERGSAGA